jgi:hypothetical protein
VLYSFYFYPARLWTVRRAGSGASSGAGRWWVMRRVVASDAKTDWMIVVQAIAVLLEEADCGVHRGFSGGAGRSTPLRSERVRRGAKHPGCPSGYRLKTESRSNYSGRCEGNGRWWDEAEVAWRNGRGQRLRGLPPPDLSSSNLPMKRVALAMAHLDHDRTNNHLRNLKALCQRCHMIHDREEHLRRRARTYRARRAFGDLFAGPY